jgi:hypothetical protein
MLKKRFWWPALIIVVSLCCSGILWLILHQAALPRKSTETSIDDKQMSFDEAEGVIMKIPGTAQNDYWELHINKIENLGDVDNLTQIRGTYFVNKAPFYQVSGETGIIYLKTRVFQVNGNVVLKTVDASKELNAAELVWDPGLNRITARREVVLKTPQATVTTDEIVSNARMDHAVFSGPTKVLYQRVSHE